MAKNKKPNNPLDGIVGGEYPKMNELIGKTFILRSVNEEKVKGYKTPAGKYEIEFEGVTKEYGSFSGVLLKQARQIVEKVGLPVKLSLIGKKSEESGNDYLTFSQPE